MKTWKKSAILCATVLLMLTWRPLLAIVTNAITDYIQIGTPSNPASGNSRVYVNSTTHQLSCLNSDGSSCAPSGGGGGGFIQTLTAPVHGSFTQTNYNAGGTVTTETDNTSPVTSITLQQSDPGATENIVGNLKSKIAATFTITAAFAFAGDGSTNPIPGMWLTDSTPTMNEIVSYTPQNGGIEGVTFNNLGGGFDTFNFQIPTTPWPTGPLGWIQVQETVSARIYRVSSDGITWNQIFTESNTANFTTAKYGFAITSRNGHSTGGSTALTLYSWTETTP